MTQDRAHSFGAVAAAYDAGRPTFPADALTWILGPGRLQILDLGAGTGKLTAVAAALGHDVVAVDPSEEMLSLCRRIPGVDTMVGAAESIPLAHGSVDAVIVGQAFHWFDHARALPEIARVLRPHGVLGLLWNNYDTVVPWVRRLHRAIIGEDFLIGSDEFDPMPTLLQSDLFSMVETARFRHWHDLDRGGPEATGPVALARRSTDRVAARSGAGADRRDLRRYRAAAGAAADAVLHELLPDPSQRPRQLPPHARRAGRPTALTQAFMLLPGFATETLWSSSDTLTRPAANVHLFALLAEGCRWTRKQCTSAKPVPYQAVHDASDFQELKRRYKNFVVPWTIAFMTWYLAYVACNNWARDFMSHKLIGHINVALVFGLLQFVSTFAIAAIYGRFANRKLDPLASGLNAKYKRERRR